MKSVISVRCPDCGGTLEIDVARQRVLSHKPDLKADEAEDKAELFDEVVKRVKNRGNEGKDLFDTAQKQVADGKKRVEELFGEVQKRIAEEKEKGDDGKPDPRDLFWD